MELPLVEAPGLLEELDTAQLDDKVRFLPSAVQSAKLNIKTK